jgi:hypothetical protein
MNRAKAPVRLFRTDSSFLLEAYVMLRDDPLRTAELALAAWTRDTASTAAGVGLQAFAAGVARSEALR